MLRVLTAFGLLAAAAVSATACQSNSDCTSGDYCQSDATCHPCADMSTQLQTTCDAKDGQCCSIDFLSHCPTDPHDCVFHAEDNEAYAKYEKKLSKKTKVGQSVYKEAYKAAKRESKTVHKALKKGLKQGKKVAKRAYKADKKYRKGTKGCPCKADDYIKAQDASASNSAYYRYNAYEVGAECKAWDGKYSPDYCTGTDDPSWCDDMWCAVDVGKCNLPTSESAVYPGVYYSYDTCGNTNSYSR